jgi:hypothetical protein
MSKKAKKRPRKGRTEVAGTSTRPLKSFLDTSVARTMLTGHGGHSAYLRSNIPQRHYVNNYVRMEFYKSLLLSWTQLYFESADGVHATFGDAISLFENKFATREIKNTMAGLRSVIPGWVQEGGCPAFS